MRGTGFYPVQGLAAGLVNAAIESFAQRVLLFFSDCPGVRRDQEYAAATCNRVQPLAAHRPGYVWGKGNTVRIERVERLVLRHAKGKCVDADAARPLPRFSAHVVPGAGGIENSNRQVPDGVAAKDNALFPAACTETPIQHGYDLSIGGCAIVEVPIPPSRGSPHLTAPLAQQFEGGEVMLDEIKAPFARFCRHRRGSLKRLWNRGIVCQWGLLIAGPTPTGSREQKRAAGFFRSS